MKLSKKWRKRNLSKNSHAAPPGKAMMPSSSGKGKEAAGAGDTADTVSRIMLRVYGGGVDIIRETTNVRTGHIHTESLGWADLRRAEITDELRQKLTPAEADFVRAKLASLRDDVERKDRADAFMLHAEINRIRIWAHTASRRDIENIAESLIYEMQELRKLLMQRLSED